MRTLFLAFATLLCTCVRAQSNYFQQEVNYEIDARLDDENHVLHARLKLAYTNNSPDTLRVIPFHVWPRAYSSDETAFAKQQLRNGSTRFHFANKNRRGTLDSLGYYVDGQPTGHTFSEAQPDISILLLNQPLLPGKAITIETPFRVKIPASFSRLGHVGQSYQMTQWYPKPAVYDREGWHVMPYLDRGEFYSEFGDFTVRLTLPDNYVVGATGVLQEASEHQWMLEKATADRAALSARTDLSEGFVKEEFPASSATTKTISYRADNVHDFAWFADKRFKILHDTMRFGAGTQDAKNGINKPGTTDVWALFTETEADYWKDATDYLKRSTRFYSERVGRYPYPQVTGVQSALSAGGGMEYPMITVIGRNFSAADLDEVLAHEVGHNWFYGILASNERDHPWMDEGLNSYYEQLYMRQFYPGHGFDAPIVGNIKLDELGYAISARLGKDQAPNTRSDSLSTINYWIEAYSKPAMLMHELAGIVGEAEVDRAMQSYYQQWKFRHPQPEDFFSAMNAALDEELAPWFAAGFMSTKTSDWKAKGGKTPLAGGIPEVIHSGNRQPPVVFADQTDAKGRRVISNPLDLWTHNNVGGKNIAKGGLLTAQEEAGISKGFVLPLAGYNLNDGVQLGVALHNRTLEPRKFEWMVAPMYGFGSGKLTGFMGGQYRIPRAFDKFRMINVALGTQRWSDFTLQRTEEAYTYQRTAMRAEIIFDNPPITERESSLSLQVINLARDRPVFAGDPIPSGTETRANLFVRLGYRNELKRELTPFGYAIHLEFKNRNNGLNEAFEASHVRLEVEVNGANQYEQGKFLRYRFFGGYFLANQLRESAFNPASGFSLVDNATSDYRYDGLYLGRGAPVGNWTEQQLGRQQGGFRAPISPAFGFGRSNSYLAAFNVDADLPLQELPIPLVAFFDAGFYGAKATGNDPITGRFSWVGGVGLAVAEGRVGVYLPLVSDPDTKDLLEQRGNLLSRLNFRLNLEGWVPWRWVDGLF